MSQARHIDFLRPTVRLLGNPFQTDEFPFAAIPISRQGDLPFDYERNGLCGRFAA